MALASLSAAGKRGNKMSNKNKISMKRRQVLAGAAGTALGALGSRFVSAATPASNTGALESGQLNIWQSVRRQFHFSGQAPLNAANLCPAFSDVLETHRSLASRLSADPGFLNRRDVVHNELDQARRACARLLGVKHREELAFVRNTSEANAVVINGLDLAASDEVLLWRENHSTNYRSWHYRHQRYPFRVRSLALQLAERSDTEIVKQFTAALSENTRVVSFSHVSNISGARLPAAAICKAVHAYNPDIFVHIDGAQSWGSMAVNLDEIGCDSYSSSAHKWLCGPRGTGVLFVRNAWAQRLHPLILGYDFEFDYPLTSLPDNAQRFECLGQRDTAAVAALGVAARKHLDLGAARIEARVAELTSYTRQALERAGIAVRSPAGAGRSHGVVVADLGGSHKSYGAFLALHNAGIASAYVEGNTVHCSPQGLPEQSDSDVLLRLCPHIYNNTADIDAAVEIAARIHSSNFEIIKEVVRFL